jgi:type IV pilus assembly protein PilM
MSGKIDEVLKKLKGLSAALTGPRYVLGVDVGSYAIKVAFIVEEGGGATLKAWGHLPLASRPEASPEEKKVHAIKVLRAFLIEKGLKVKEAVTALSGNSVIVRYVKFPRLTKAELASTLAAEAEPFIPFDINEVQLGFHILDDIVEDGLKKMETVLVAAKRDLVTARLEVLQGAGLVPTIIDVDSFALENVHERLRDPQTAGGATLYLNIGHMVTNLSIIEGGVTRVVRDIFISGSTLTKAIVKGLQVDAAKAEELKKSHGIIVDSADKEKALAEGDREALGVSQAVVSVVKDLVAEVHRSVDFYLSQGPERGIAHIILAGGTASLKNLSQHLTVELRVPVSVLKPFACLRNPPEDVPASLAPTFAVAVGLALRRNKDWL